MTRSAANLLLLLAGAIWGMGFVTQSAAMASVGPWTFVAARFLIAAATVAPFAWLEGRKPAATPMPAGAWRGFVLTGLVLFAGAILQQVGLLTTSVTNSGFLTGLYVVFTPLLALVLMRHRAHWVVWPAALAALIGIALLGGGTLAALTVGDGLTVVCALFWSLQILLVGKYAQSSGRPLLLNTVQFATTAVIALIGAVLLEPISLEALGAVWKEIAYAGIFSSGLAFSLQTIGQRWTSAPQAAIFLSSEALFAALFGALVLGERMQALGFLGCALIFAAILAVELVPLWGKRRSQPA
ncbi:DMT family transporter [Mangrovicella endophytica]|uniref:DMT family transporter n=1 Tax=Mangrovicella endophytica TaxID=2066697 RepID=UPI000C9EA013|nr:DMT family transporter [Mangrovicella endophytica]